MKNQLQTNYKNLKQEVLNTANILIEEDENNKKIVLKVLDYIKKTDDIEFPHELDVEGYEDNSITFSDGLIDIKVAKQDDKYVGTIESCWFGSPNEEPFQLPLPKISYTYENQFNAIFQILNMRWDIINRYYLPKMNIQNNEELSKNLNFTEWKKIMFGIGLCGLDFVDVHNAVKNKVCTISQISVKGLDSLPKSVDFPSKVSNLILAIKIPKNQGLDEINKIAEIFTEKVDEDSQVLWQSINHDKDEVEIIYLYN